MWLDRTGKYGMNADDFRHVSMVYNRCICVTAKSNRETNTNERHDA